jgi:NADPH:quinone reductase-like Zn-dependent oxidoreductase
MVIFAGSAGAELRWQEVPDPQPAPGELLVAVRAVGMNRADLLLRAGHYEGIATKPPAPIAGLEAAGEVIALGEGVTGFRLGDRVMGMPSGAYAEKVLLHHRLALRVPAGFSWEEAAALPVALLTAHDGLVSNGSLARGETVLVQGASTGVGIVAMQIAKYWGASVVIGTSTSADKLARLAPYGIDVGIDTRREDFAQRVLELTADRGADVILDMVGAGAVAGHLACAAVKARWIQVGRVSGAKAEIDLNELSRKRLRLIGVTFRTRSLDEFAGVVAAAERDLGAAVAARRIVSPVDRVLALDAACEAHAYMRSNALLGKIILKP